MNLLSRIAVAFYMAVLLAIGSWMMVLETSGILELMKRSGCAWCLDRIPLDAYSGLVMAVALLTLNFIFWRALTLGERRDATIAFDNPAGRVNVSLSALEDLVRRVVSTVPEVKDVRTFLSAGKKGLVVRVRIVLNLDVNIPEMTSRLQDLVRRKIQDTIGIEEPVMVRIDVTKIIPGGKRAKAKEKSETVHVQPEQTPVPFEGYRA